MLQMDKLQQIEGVDVFGDHQDISKFYLIPEQPRFRLDEKGRPIFKFLKYRFPIDRKDGRKGGGYVVFDVEFSVPDEKLAIIKKTLQEQLNKFAKDVKMATPPTVKIAAVPYTEGTSRLVIMKPDGVLVERIFDAGKPSLYGKNISTYSIELTPEGATFFEQALQGKGGFVSVVYELKHEARFPPIKAWARWEARAFYQFIQKIDIEERVCAEDDYSETLSEIMTRSESYTSDIDWGSSNIDAKTKDSIRNTMFDMVKGAVERNMIKALQMENPEDARKWYQEKDIEDVRKEVMRFQAASFTYDFTEHTVLSRPINPQGTLPNITNLVDKDKKPILWKDYAVTIDLDDPFFKQLGVDVFVNADFNDLPINSVEVKLNYNGKPMSLMGGDSKGEARFSGPDDRARFASYVVNDNWKYKCSYQVNYKGTAKTYQSPVMDMDDTKLTIGVDDVGILKVDLVPGDINFDEVNQVQITMQYEDKDKKVKLIEQQFIMNPQTPTHRFQKIIFVERDKPYRYSCRYYMKDGKEFQSDWKEDMSPILNINDPFSGKKSINVVAAGNLEEEIQTIFMDLRYVDALNKYEQAISIALNQDNPNYLWEFPVINENGSATVSYSGQIAYRKGTTEAIPETTAKSSTIMVNTIQDMLEVTVSALLLNMEDEVKMVRVQLRYSDPANQVSEKKDLSFTADKDLEQYWTVKLKDRTKAEYSWGATFYMQDGTKRTVPVTKTDALSIDLELPEE